MFLHPFRHRFGAAYQAGILSVASGSEMADVEQLKKIVPFVTYEITFGQNVYLLMFGITVSNLNFRIKINPVKQSIQSKSVGQEHMSHRGIRTLITIFITASLSSKTYNIELEPECVPFDGR